MGSLSILQGISPTQELNQVHLLCRWILYQLSYQESPYLLLQYMLFLKQGPLLWSVTMVDLDAFILLEDFSDY